MTADTKQKQQHKFHGRTTTILSPPVGGILLPCSPSSPVLRSDECRACCSIRTMAALVKKTKFTYIFIPEDEGKDLQELDCEYTSDTIVPCLTNACKKHYQKAKKVNESKYRDQLLAQIKSKDPNAVIPEETLKMLSQVQLVSIDPLLFNEANNDYYGVSLYTDDSASAKNSKVNSRATSIAHACGKNITVIGDAFLSASRDDQRDYFVRCDLKLEDITGANDNNWMERARLQTQNMQQQRQTQADNEEKGCI